jgi:hypothetical protein
VCISDFVSLVLSHYCSQKFHPNSFYFAFLFLNASPCFCSICSIFLKYTLYLVGLHF